MRQADVESEIIHILESPFSEGTGIDYKLVPYNYDRQQATAIKDVLAMLNSFDDAGNDKFIIFGVNDQKELVGIEPESMKDDNEWQNLFKKITHSPIISTGTVSFEEKAFGYFCISGKNRNYVYEPKENISDSGENRKKIRTVYKGQGFWRVGSQNDEMLERDREKLKSLVTSDQYLIPINFSRDSKRLYIAALIGGWDTTNAKDVSFIMALAEENEDTFLDDFQVMFQHYDSLFQFDSGVWRVNNRSRLLMEAAPYINDRVILGFFKLSRAVILSPVNDDLHVNFREALVEVTNHREDRYSTELMHGISESLAFLGNNPNKLTHCTYNIIKNQIKSLIDSVFKCDDNAVFLRLGSEFHFLEEADPDAFLSGVEYAVTKNSVFQDCLKIQSFGDQLAEAVSSLAVDKSLFTDAMLVLMTIAALNETALNYMRYILIPFYPQTHASLVTRIAVLKQFHEENEPLYWKLLICLLPGRNSEFSIPLQTTKYYPIEPLRKSIMWAEYWEQVDQYIKLACNSTGDYVDHLCDLIHLFGKVSEESRNLIIHSISSSSNHLSNIEKEKLWNGLESYSHRNRLYKSADWALSEEELAVIDQLKGEVLPDSKCAGYKRLFQRNQFDLRTSNEDFDKSEDELKEKQLNCLNDIYGSQHLKGIIAFVHEVEDKRLVGILFGSLITDEDCIFLISHRSSETDSDFLKGLWGSLSMNRLNSCLSDQDDQRKSEILANQLISKDLICMVSKLSLAAQHEFWKKVDVIHLKELNELDLDFIIQQLNDVGRMEESIQLIALYKDEKQFDPEIVVSTLSRNKNDIGITSDNFPSSERYEISEIISWLQQHGVSRDVMIKLEWKYLLVLEEETVSPSTIYKTMSSDPQFYVDLLTEIQNDIANKANNDSIRNVLFSKEYKLFSGWKLIPGLDEDGRFNNEQFSSWIERMIPLAKKENVYHEAMVNFGKTAFYSPQDPNGFFMEVEIARVLNDDPDGLLLRGYELEAVNSVGVRIVDGSGKQMFDLSRKYNAKAEQAGGRGLFRFAKSLRILARRFEAEGRRDIEEFQTTENRGD